MVRYTIHFINGETLICKAIPVQMMKFMSGDPAYQNGVFTSTRDKPIEVSRDSVVYIEAR